MKSDITYIKKLVGKWEDGTISSSEETTLKDYFKKESVPEDLLDYKILIVGLEGLSIEQTKEREEFTPNLDFLSEKPSSQTYYKKVAARAFTFSSVAIAAAVALFVIFGKEPLCYINGKPVHDQQTALAVVDYLDILSTLDDMPSELDALSTLTFDDNFNF